MIIELEIATEAADSVSDRLVIAQVDLHPSALKDHGYAVVEEAATDIIAFEQSRGNYEPWRQPDFIDKIVRLQQQRQVSTSTEPAPLQ